MWMARPSGVLAARTAARTASAVVVGNRFLEGWYSQHNRNVVLIPTSIDTGRFSLIASLFRDPFTIGWTGSRATLPYLEGIEPALNAFLDQQPTARLLVVCDAPPRFHGRVRHHLDFEVWTPERESELLGRMSVGIMPLPDDELARGKCSFKMLQYMARGLPVIVSPVGSNADILGEGEVGWGASVTDDWVDALRDCWRDPERAARLGRNGRALVENHYSADVAVEKLARLFTELATGKRARCDAARR
jgi:glycosyltransferase involved in cell wall biosynthesis